jgi:hypothetical protein
MSELRSAADAIAAVDLDDLPGAEKLDLVADLSAAVNRLEAVRGPTSCDNGALLCERHHTACHEGGFAVARISGTSRWRTYRPDGSEIGTRAGP